MVAVVVVVMGSIQVAGGTFVYVAVVDLLTCEFPATVAAAEPGRARLGKFGAFWAGFALLSALLASAGDHGH